MRKIKDSVIKKWFDVDKYMFGININHMHMSPGAHEREEVKTIVLDCSIYCMGEELDYFEELKAKVESVLSYLDFNHYFYGAASLPAFLVFHEKDSKIFTQTLTASYSCTLLEYKEIIREASPDIVALYTVFRDVAGEWTVRFGMKKGIEPVFAKESNYELYEADPELFPYKFKI